MTSHRYTRSSSFGPTLETERLPVLGEDRHAGRDRAWRRIFTALSLFWIAIGVALLVAPYF